MLAVVAMMSVAAAATPPVPAWLIGRWGEAEWEYHFYPNRTFTTEPHSRDGYYMMSAWVRYRGTFAIEGDELVLNFENNNRDERWRLPKSGVPVARPNPSFALLTGTARPTALTFPHLLKSFQPMDRTRLGVEWPYHKLPPRGTK